MKIYRAFLLLIISFLIISCEKENKKSNNPIECSGAYSIVVNNGQVLVSGWKNLNSKLSTVYWIDSFKSDSSAFTTALSQGYIYKGSVDEQSRITYVHKSLTGKVETYKFDQRLITEREALFYHKGNELVKMDTAALGAIITMCLVEDKPYFAGCFGELVTQKSGKTVAFKTPFLWDGGSTLIELPLSNSAWLRGVSSIYVDKENNRYVGGLIGLPMYWKNSNPVILETLYGEVNQITVSGADVYAVGLYNKFNSNSTAHTACYWKNQERIDLEDNAQAYDIYIDGNDIYVAGSVGDVPARYKPCYWKNGVRVDLAH